MKLTWRRPARLIRQGLAAGLRRWRRGTLSQRSHDGEPLSLREVGNRGEDAAVKCLQRQNYRILLRNYLCQGGEIDIIAEDCGTIAFVEVKARAPGSYLTPAQAVDEGKRGRVRHAARQYLAAFRDSCPVRYDIVSVYLDANQQVERVDLEKDAFR